MKRIISIFAVLVLGVALSCVKENKESLAPSFQIDMDNYGSIVMEMEKQVAFIPVTTNVSETEWVISTSADWCQASRSISSQKGIMIAADSNTDKESMRQAYVSVKAAGKEYKIIVSQFGYGPAIVVNNVSVGPEGGRVYMDVTANVPINESLIAKPEYDKEDGDNWIHFVGIDESTKAFSTSRFIFDVTTNELPDKRVATVPVKALSTADQAANKQCVITQKSIDISDPAVFTDEKIPVLQVEANQDDPYYGEHAAALIDGNYSSFYHSPAGPGKTQFPVVLTFYLSGSQRVDYISIMHRDGTHWRGQIGTFEVYARTSETEPLAFVESFDFGGNGGYQTAHLTTPIENAVEVMIKILDDADPAHSDGEESDGQYVTIAEVEFFTTNQEEVNSWIDRIFKDRSCSELKDGVTKKQIVQMNAVSPYLASKVAIPLLNGTYDENEKDFRIHSYEPYSDAHVNKALVTQLYSSMNNPTGIEVKSGQDIIVCVDQVPANQTVSLAIYGDESDEGPNYGGGGEKESINQNTLLHEGVNNVRITADGMAYIMNITPLENRADLATFKNVKVHILPGCGTVQGYFDPARHDDERYHDLLSRCTYRYFMVKGEKCLFLFHTNQLRTDWPLSIRSGIGAWDDIVSWEWELMGLDKVKWFNNHMLAVTSSSSKVYMNASNRRVQFGVNTIKNIGSREVLNTEEIPGVSNIWGPAHEIGHCNQMAINWRSCTESSNNLFSNYANFKLAGDNYYKSRWSRGDKLDKLGADCVEKTPWALLGDGSYQGEDPNLHMRMYWQLWNYYHNCGYKKDFYPALFNYFRDGHQMPNQSGDYYNLEEKAGECQLQFYEACCIVSGEDLTEFFDTWGFFRTIDQTYSQYGETRYTVTQEMINTSKAKIRDMKLPKAAPMQYLEDRTKHNGETYSQMGYWTQFKDKKAITKQPKYQVSGSNITLSDCDEAVAVEVRSGESATGDLRYFSNLFGFTLPSKVNLSNCSIWAVQADGTRVAVTKK